MPPEHDMNILGQEKPAFLVHNFLDCEVWQSDFA